MIFQDKCIICKEKFLIEPYLVIGTFYLNFKAIHKECLENMAQNKKISFYFVWVHRKYMPVATSIFLVFYLILLIGMTYSLLKYGEQGMLDDYFIVVFVFLYSLFYHIRFVSAVRKLKQMA